MMKNETKSLTDDHGFMYIEVLASMVLLSFALLSAAPMFMLAAGENASSIDQSFATNAAHETAEDLKNTPWKVLESGNDQLQYGNLDYTRIWTVTEDTPHPGMTEIVVTVTPQRNNGHGGNRAVTVTFNRVRFLE